MSLPSFRTLCLGLGAATLFTLAQAAGDAGLKPPVAPSNPIVDKSPRCLPATVNECRASCERKKFETTSQVEIVKKQNECKQDCIRGC